MKNKKLLVLLPAVALMLAGCGGPNDDDHSGSDTSTSDTSGSTTGSTTNTGSTGSTGTTDTSGGQSLPDGVTEADFGTADAPITLAQAKTLIDKLITDLPTESDKTHKFEGLPIFLKSPVKSNKAKNDSGESQFINLKDGTLEFTISWGIYADGVNYGATENDMAGKIATIKGYGALYWKNADTIVYELIKKDNSNKPTVLKVEDSGEHHAEPAPQNKTFAELYAMSITSGDDVKNQLYVSRGKIKAFKTGSTKDQYGNMTLIDPADASKEIVVYGASASNWLVWQDAVGAYNTVNPKDFMTNNATKDLAVGDIIDFTGVCYMHSGVKNLSIKITGKYEPTPETVAFSENSYVYSTETGSVDLSTLVTLTPAGSDTLVYEITAGSGASIDGSTLTITGAGTVTVTVSCKNHPSVNNSAEFTFNAPAAGEITALSLSETECDLYLDGEESEKSHDFVATVEPATDRTEDLVWRIVGDDSPITLQVNPENDTEAIVTLKDGVTETGVANIRVYAKDHESSFSVTATINILQHASKYGTQENPLTVAQALALVASDVPSGQQTAEKVYMRGVIKSNGAWTTQYSNFNNGTVLADPDDSSSITAWQVTTADTTKQLGENALKGLTATVYGNIENGTHGIQFVGKGASTLLDFADPEATITSFTLNEESVALNVGASTTVFVESYLPLNGNPTHVSAVTWSSDDELVAKVDGGSITGVALGTTKVHAIIDGVDVFVNVEVTDAHVASWGKATSIAVNDQVVFVVEDASREMIAISKFGSNYVGETATYSEAISHTFVLTVVEGNSTGKFAFKTSDDKYLAWSAGNTLSTVDAVNANSSWTVAIDANGNATITNVADSSRVMLYNVNSPRIATYTGHTAAEDGYNAIQFYAYK